MRPFFKEGDVVWVKVEVTNGDGGDEDYRARFTNVPEDFDGDTYAYIPWCADIIPAEEK